MPDISLLKESRLFAGLDAEALAAVSAVARRIDLAKGAPLFHEGDAADATFLILRGKVKLVQHTADGRQVTLRYMAAGDAAGISAVLEKAVYPATATPATPTTVLRWGGRDFARLLDRYPRIAKNVIPMLVARVHEVQEQLRELATERVERRVARVLLRLAGQTGVKSAEGVLIDMPLTRQDLAEMTGTTLYSVSRILSGWEGQGVVKIGRKKVVVRDLRKLTFIAESD
jgi:CRP-like cAMP-binding protein